MAFFVQERRVYTNFYWTNIFIKCIIDQNCVVLCNLIGKGFIPMGRMREHRRITCVSHCIFNYEGVNYHALLENLSLSGALLQTGDEHPCGLYIGTTVDLMLCNNPQVCPIKYSCKVIRLASSTIGVNFQ